MRECGLGACTADFAEWKGLWHENMQFSGASQILLQFSAIIIQTCAERMMQPSELLQHSLQNTNQKCTGDDDGHESVELC
jgi:hypothetical protein